MSHKDLGHQWRCLHPTAPVPRHECSSPHLAVCGNSLCGDPTLTIPMAEFVWDNFSNIPSINYIGFYALWLLCGKARYWNCVIELYSDISIDNSIYIFHLHNAAECSCLSWSCQCTRHRASRAINGLSFTHLIHVHRQVSDAPSAVYLVRC